MSGLSCHGCALPETDKAYLAGLVDGEGTMGLYPHKGKGRLEYVPQVAIYSTEKRFLTELKELWKIGGVYNRAEPRNPNWKICYEWRFTHQAAYHILDHIFRYLKLKKQQATVLKEYQKFISPMRHGNSKPFPNDIRRAQEQYHQRLKSLNKKGSQDPKTCHNCCYEWADACDRLRIHMPSDNPACQDCRRNPNRKVLATGDHYVTLEQLLSEGFA